jgi:septal ring factor EnvC (AmiA/AmiB activator)
MSENVITKPGPMGGVNAWALGIGLALTLATSMLSGLVAGTVTAWTAQAVMQSRLAAAETKIEDLGRVIQRLDDRNRALELTVARQTQALETIKGQLNTLEQWFHQRGQPVPTHP